MAFDAKRDHYGFGRQQGQSEEDYFSSYLRAVKRRMAAINSHDPDVPTVTVRYEDLMSQIDQVATGIGLWLGVELDPHGAILASDEYRHHKTASTIDQSVGRWRSELSHRLKDRFVEELGEDLDRFGYARE
jgi:hypothetical protein